MNNYKHPFLILLTFALFVSTILGNVHPAYAQTEPGWSDPINLSMSGSSTDPSVVVDTEGTIHVIWFDDIDGYRYTMSKDGISWAPPENVKFPFSEEGGTQATFVTFGSEVHIFWQNPEDQTLYYSRSLSSNLGVPSTWTNYNELADGVVGYDAQVGLDGSLYVVYVSNLGRDAIPPGIVFRRLDGSGWSRGVSIYSSQYFRSITIGSANVQLGVLENDDSKGNIYIVWDDRSQKRVFMTRSLNSGVEWETPTQISGPEENIGLAIPFNVNIGFFNNAPVLTWWVGSPGVRCSLYSRMYEIDGGGLKTANEQRKEIPFCPQTNEFIVQNGEFPLLALSAQDELVFIAWNGSNWSLVQDQKGLFVFENPVTLDGVVLGCRKVTYARDKIYSVGCDIGSGGDIWFRSRELGILDDWFPPPLAWKAPVEVKITAQQISGLSAVEDESSTVHTFWIQQSNQSESAKSTLQYAEWKDDAWSNPVELFPGVEGAPVQFAASADIPGRLLLTWIDGDSGDLLFSWANSDRAVNPSEWDSPVYIPSPSHVNSSPDILADPTGNIILAYAVPVNEHRGVYFVFSDDAGKTWSEPFLLFDAVTSGWDMVDQPEVALSGDGRLHALFKRISVQGDQDRSSGLYYSQSIDGGVKWSDAALISETTVSWSGIVTYGDQTVHRLWQEISGTNLVNYHQVSLDGGANWNPPSSIGSALGNIGSPSVAVDRNGHLHLMQFTYPNSLNILHEEWDGTQWLPQASYQLKDQVADIDASMTIGITAEGDLLAMGLMNYYDRIDGRVNELISMVRSLDNQVSGVTPKYGIIPTPEISTLPVDEVRDIVLTPTLSSPLLDLNDPSGTLSRNRNLTGFFFLLGVLIVTAIILRPRRNSRKND